MVVDFTTEHIGGSYLGPLPVKRANVPSRKYPYYRGTLTHQLGPKYFLFDVGVVNGGSLRAHIKNLNPRMALALYIVYIYLVFAGSVQILMHAETGTVPLFGSKRLVREIILPLNGGLDKPPFQSQVNFWGGYRAISSYCSVSRCCEARQLS